MGRYAPLTADSGQAACTYRAVRGPGGPKNSSAVFLRNPGPLGPLCVSLQFYSKNGAKGPGPPWTTLDHSGPLWHTFGVRDLASLGCQGLRHFFFSFPLVPWWPFSFFSCRARSQVDVRSANPINVGFFGLVVLACSTTSCSTALRFHGLLFALPCGCCPAGAYPNHVLGLPKVTPQARGLAFHCPWPNAWV